MTKFFNKFKTSFSGPFLAYLLNFEGGKKKKLQKIWLSRTTSCRFLAQISGLCQNLQETNDTNPRKRLERWKDGRMDRRTEGQKDDRKDGQTLFYRSLLVTSR